MSQPYKSGRQQNINLGISSVTENHTVLQTIGKVGIGTTNAQNHSLFVVGTTNITGDINVGGASTFVGVGTFGNDLYVANQLYVGGVNVGGGASIGEDITTRNLLATGISTFNGAADFNGDIDVDGHTELDNVTVSGVATITSLDVQSNFDVYDTQAVFHNNLFVAGNLSIGGTTTNIAAQDLQVFDKEITLGVTTDAFGNDVSNDITANHGGIAIASTEGSPLVDLTLTGFSSIPPTYKQLMWVAADSYGFGTTDAWMFNYAVGIGSTLVPNGVRFAVNEIQFTDDTIDTPNLNVENNLTVGGISTFTNGPVFIGSGTSTGTLNQNLQVTGGGYISSYLGIGYTDPFSNLAIYDQDGAWISLVDPGSSSATFENNNGILYIRAEQGGGNSEIVFQTGTSNYEQKPSVSGSNRVRINSSGELLVNLESSTGVTNQKLQVDGGAYVSGYMGVGTSNPSTNLYVQGNEYVTGVVTATRFFGEFVGTALSITGITSATSVYGNDLTVSGIATVGALYIDNTQVISNNRDLENITTATLGITSLSQLYVSGVSTFVGLLDANGGATIDNIRIGVADDNTIDTVTGDLILDSAAGTIDINDQLIVSGISTFSSLVEFTGGIDLNNTNIVNVNGISISDPGTNEGIQWLGGNLWKIYEAPNDLSNLAGNLQFVSGASTRVFTLDTNGNGEFTGNVGIGTSLPNARLDVRGDANFAGNVIISGIATIGTIENVAANIEHLSATNLVVSGVSTFQSDIHLGDSDIAYFGTGDDMRIFHDGGAAYITNTTGILFHRAGQHFFENAAGTETFASFVENSSASLYYDNDKKFETVSTGATVTGTVYAQNFSTGNSGVGINISSDTITGPSSITIDPSAIGDNTGYVRIKGDLYVDGEQFIVNSTTIELADFNVGIATTVSSNSLLDGAGIGIGDTSIRKTLTWDNSSESLKSSENFDLAAGKVYKINEVEVLSSNQLTVPDIYATGVTTLGITTATTLYVAGVSTFVGSVNFNNDIDVDGHTELDNVNISGVTTFVGNITANGDITLSGGIDVDGHTELDNVNISGIVTTSELNVNGHSELDNLNVSGVSTFAGAADFNGDIDITGHTELDNLNVSGVSTFVGITTNQSTFFGTQLSVAGLSTFVGFSTFGNSVSIANNLDVNGDINFNGSLFQDNQPFIASRWTATSTGGDIYRLSNVGVGTSTLIATLTVGGDVNVSGVITARQFVGDVRAGVATLGITTAETLDVYTSTRLRGQIKDTFNDPGASLYVLASGGPSGNWSWQPVTAVGAGILNGIIVQEEGGTVGTAGSITTIDFRGGNIIASADPQPNGIATVRVSDTPNFDSLNVTGLSTFAGITTVTGDTLFTKQLNVSGVTTTGNLIVNSTSLFQGGIQANSTIFANGGVTGNLTGNVTSAGSNSFGQATVTGVITARQFIGDVNAGVATIATLIGTNASFTGNVSIGGTLTYEDVTNVDSIGVITARSDIRVGGNLSVVGVATLASAGGITTTGGDLYVGDDLFFKGNLYKNGQLFTSGIGIGSTAVNPQSGTITSLARIGVGFTDINFVGTGLSVTGYGTTLVVDFGNISGGGGSRVSISSIAPIAPESGDLWWESGTGDLKVYYSDDNSSQWVDANSGSQSLAIISETSPVGSGVTSSGTLWWDSGYGVLKVYYDDGDSKQWVDANSGAYINYWSAAGTSKIVTTNSVGIGTTNPTEQLQVNGNISIDGNVSYGTTTATTTSTSQVSIHSSFDISAYRSVEYTIQATQGSNFHTTKILALHDGTTAYNTEYGTIFNNVGISTYDVDISAGKIRLLATPISSSTTNFKVVFNGIKV